MDLLKLQVEKDEAGERLDIYLVEELEEFSRTEIKKFIKDGMIRVNSYKNKPSYVVCPGDIIEVKLVKEEEFELVGEDLKIEIIYEDKNIAVVYKPQGMVVHPAPGNYSGTLVNGLIYALDSLSTINGDLRPGIVHRLDKDTSGLLVVAKDDLSHDNLSKQFKERTVEREYRALVFGRVKNEEGIISTQIGRNPKNRQKMAVLTGGGREAITSYSLLENLLNYSYLSLKLKTGRTHQIRVHLNYINHPVVGDPLYSRGKNEFGLKKQFLHAYKLSFNHPVSEERLSFSNDLPNNLKNILEGLRRRNIEG